MFKIDHVATTSTSVGGPQAPQITKRDIWAQFKIDIAGKEVQTAETYSHAWIANQFGHVCLGILLGGTLGFLLGSAFSVPSPWDNVAGSVIAIIGVAWWERRAYRIGVSNATGQFPIDRKLLRANALVATAYMVLGVASAFVYRHFALTAGESLGVPNLVWFWLSSVALVIIGIRLAVPWLHQKIVWQKAGLPYLFRLAEAHPTMDDEDVKRLQELINSSPSPKHAPYQIVIGGPIGSGRTQLSAGIGTELAFRDMTVRYLTFATLLEFAARSRNPHFSDDIGPVNIAYWPWSKAQAVIIDDIGPLLAPQAQKYENHVEQFRQVLSAQLDTVRPVLARCHTVWVIGDPRGDGQISTSNGSVDQLAREIGRFCSGPDNPQPQVLVAELEPRPSERIPKPRARTHYVSA